MMKPRTQLRLFQRLRSLAPLDRGQGTNTIQAPHIAARLNRALGIREMAAVPDLARSIQPVIVVDDVSRDPATDERDAYWAVRVIHTPPAGDGAFMLLKNDSINGLVTIDELWINAASTTEFGISRETASYPAGTPAAFMPRGPSPSSASPPVRSAFLTADGQSLALSAYAGSIRFRAGGSGMISTVQPNVSLGPGQSLVIAPQVVTTAVDVTALFRERRISL